MKGIDNWDEARRTYKRGQMVRLMLGNAKWLEGLWSGDSIMVAESSPNLRHEITITRVGSRASVLVIGMLLSTLAHGSCSH